MDHERFDALARLFATTGSRRGVLGAILGGTVLGQDVASLAKPGKGRGQGAGKNRKDRNVQTHRTQRKTRSQAAPGCFTGSPCNPGPGANLAKCDFEGADFAGDNLQRSNFKGANLRNANLTGANLSDVNFGAACLVDADLTGAVIDGGTNFTDAILCRTKVPAGNGLDPDRDCNRGTPCCATCDAQHICPEGRICCNSTCAAGSCCVAADCPDQTCKTKTCNRNRQCRYTNQPNGEPGTGCTTQCCNGVCCTENQRCLDGRCLNCGPRTCPDGCCNANGVCVTQGTNQICGTGGLACRDCTANPAAPVCVDGQCVCPAPRVVCNNVCCPQGQVCDTRPETDVCCVPETREQTCGIGTANPKCGTVTNNCGQQVDCPACAPVTCRTVGCTNNTCQVTGNQPNQTSCTTAAGVPGICCDGTCVAGGQCCANANCSGSSNTCSGNRCLCGTGPACTEPNETCCGTTPQGTCIDTTTDPANCGTCGNVCPNGRCVAGQCAPCSSSSDCGAGRVCCRGTCVTGICCAFTGECRAGDPCCQVLENAPGRVCCASLPERCCFRNATTAEVLAGQPLTPCNSDADCCRGACLGGVPGSRLCSAENIQACPTP